jgi:3-dehydroquinate synthase
VTVGERIRVVAGAGSADYDVVIGEGLLARVGEFAAAAAPKARAAAVISDSNVAPLYGPQVVAAMEGALGRASLHDFPAGEANKNRERWIALTDALLEEGLGRDTIVVALGGGVTGDLAGFVAATFLRGVPVVQVPTSLVAMIDASVGGKTGVDAPAGKNLVGAFHPPVVVLADPACLATLPRSERSQGLAEAVKHGAILDAEYMAELRERAEDLLSGEPYASRWAVRRSVELKAGVVSRDERESGLREILNFGHTLGHAIEAESRFEIPHGSAVAVGMVLEARIGEAMGVTASGTADRLAEALRAMELPTELPSGMDPDRVLGWTGADKKARGGEVRYVQIAAVGSVHRDRNWARPVAPDLVREVLATGSALS